MSVLLTEELDELEEEGRLLDRGAFLREIEACGDDQNRLLEVYDKLRRLPMRPDFPYQEPSDYEEILAACGGPDRPTSRFLTDSCRTGCTARGWGAASDASPASLWKAGNGKRSAPGARGRTLIR